MTPDETAAVLEAARRREEREEQRMTALAWKISALQRQKRLPSLKTLLHRPKALTESEQQDRKAEFEELSRRMGTGNSGKRN
jgi:hypothetical protein